MPEKTQLSAFNGRCAAIRASARIRVIRDGSMPLAAAQALRRLQQRGEAQLAQSSPTAVWRNPATP